MAEVWVAGEREEIEWIGGEWVLVEWVAGEWVRWMGTG